MLINTKEKGLQELHLEINDSTRCELVNADWSIDIALDWFNRRLSLPEGERGKIAETDDVWLAKLSLLEKEMLGQEYDDVEDSNDTANLDMDPFNPEDISIEPKVVSMDSLLRRLAQRTLILNPDFQRDEVWDNVQKSRLIESLMLKIPIPMFYVSADTKSNWCVVDGLQRMSTIRDFVLGKEFYDNPEKNANKRGYGLRLEGMEFWREYEGRCFNDLPIHLQNRISETEFRFTVVNPGTPEEVKRNIFKRLNTGGVPLTQQEIRNALYTGHATELLNTLANRESFKKATDYSVRSGRMADRELVLRFVSFLIRDYKYYNRSFGSDTWLSDTMIILNSQPMFNTSDLKKRLASGIVKVETIRVYDDETIIKQFDVAMARARKLFGRHAFRKSVSGDKRSPVNKALFESWGILLSKLSDKEFCVLMQFKDKMLEEYTSLLHSSDFIIATSRDSMRHTSVAYRYNKITELIKKYTENA